MFIRRKLFLATEKHLKTKERFDILYYLGRTKKMNKKVILGMLVVSALLCSNVLVIGNTAVDKSTLNIQRNGSSYEALSKSDEGSEIVLDENFSANLMPPTDWELRQTHPTQTWYIDSSLPHTQPYCASVHRGTSSGLQNEWLITPMLDFTQYTGSINLSFWWYTSCYVAHWKDYIDLNVSISIDNGSTWTLLWSDDNITGNYTSWKWFNTDMGKNIDLSKYAGENQVKIGFEYYSNVTDQSPSQEVSIDDIYVYAEKTNITELTCYSGGPYEWCWDNQHNYIPAGVRFHGNIAGGQWWKCKWLWDFGDNSTSTLPLMPVHDYADVGNYSVSLMVIDNSTTPHRIAFDYTTVRIFVMPAPEIDIEINKPSWGIQATIKNDGIYNATQINWTIKVRWGIIQERKVANGTIERLGPNNISESMKSGYFLKFGIIHIEISAIPENIPGVNKEFTAFKIGPFVLNAHETVK